VLNRVLEAVESSRGGTDLRSLSRELGVERSALEGMIEFWVRKGRLVDWRSDALADGEEPEEGAMCAECGPSCYGVAECPFVVRLK
jgi:hypothetical protein